MKFAIHPRTLLSDLLHARNRRSSTVTRAGDHDRIYLYHIRRTAGISLGAAFLQLSCDDGERALDQLSASGGSLVLGDRRFVAWNRKLIERGDYFFAFTHDPSHRLRLPKNTFTITCLRDPVDRFVSYYQHEKRKAKDGTGHLVELGNAALTLREFTDLCPRKRLLHQLYMFSRRLDPHEAADGVLKCSFVMRTECFDSSVRLLGETLDLPLSVLGANRGPRDQCRVDDRDQHFLRERLQSEYDMIALLTAAGMTEATTDFCK